MYFGFKLSQSKIFLMVALNLVIQDLNSCTGIRLKARDSTVVYARTLEFRKDLKSQILYIPKGHKFVGATSFKNINKSTNKNGKKQKNSFLNGLEWRSKYCALGANALGINEFIDGLNEKGLAGGLFYFPDYAQYQDISKDQAKISIGSWQILTYLLTTCANISQAKHEIQKIKVSNAIFEAWGSVIPVHVILHDDTGASIVLEYTKGQLNIYENSLGVLTNSPNFNWHITNIRNYVNLSSINLPKLNLSGNIFAPLGQGSGMLGLPGDFSPPSRFVRAVFFSQNILQPKDSSDAVDSAFHILDLFNIPKGVVKDRDKQPDYTRWISASDLKNKCYYFHTYDNRQVYKIELDKLVKTKNKLTVIPMQRKPQIYNLTSKF